VRGEAAGGHRDVLKALGETRVTATLSFSPRYDDFSRVTSVQIRYGRYDNVRK
jgi:hypothetical protein